MSQFPPHTRWPLNDAACRLANASSSHSHIWLLSATVSAFALLALAGHASAQQAATTNQPQQNVQAPAATPQSQQSGAQPSGQVQLRPVEVTAVKPKKAAKKRPAQAPAPAVANAGGQSGGESATAAPTPVQAKTELGRLTVATPLAGTVVVREELENVRAADMQRELLPMIPGVSMVRNLRIPIGGKAYTNDLMDGYSMKSATLGNTGFLDEVNAADIESVEITRGPGSVLHSSKAVGGTINVITRDPPLTPEYGIWGDAGTYGLRRTGAHAAGSSENGAVGVSVNANYLQDEGWRDRS